MKKLVFVLLLSVSLLAPGLVRAQKSVWEGSKEQLEKVQDAGKSKVGKIKQWKQHIQNWGLDTAYNYALSASGRLNTNGWSGGLSYLRQKSAGKKILWQLHFSEIKHEKEIKQQRSDNTYDYLGKTRPYTLGKVNNAYTLQLAYGREQMLFPALLNGNLSVSLRYSGGPSLGMLKPIYLDLIYVEYVPGEVAYLKTEKYTPSNADRFLNPSYIQGKNKWSKGLNEIKFIPGLFGELAFAIEPDKHNSFVKTILIGGNAAFYASNLVILAERPAYRYQASFFVGLTLGKRWK